MIVPDNQVPVITETYFVYFLGSQTLIEKIRKFKPKIAVFNGKGIYEVFSGLKSFPFGKQPEKIEGTDTVRYHRDHP